MMAGTPAELVGSRGLIKEDWWEEHGLAVMDARKTVLRGQSFGMWSGPMYLEADLLDSLAFSPTGGRGTGRTFGSLYEVEVTRTYDLES